MRPVVEGQRSEAIISIVSKDVAIRLGRNVRVTLDVARSSNNRYKEARQLKGLLPEIC